jgi:hypothetical protein
LESEIRVIGQTAGPAFALWPSGQLRLQLQSSEGSVMSIQRSATSKRIASEVDRVLLPDRGMSRDRWEDIERRACDLAVDLLVGQAYNEDAFWYFLEIERKRVDLTNRWFVLLMIDLKSSTPAETEPQIDIATAHVLFSALALSLRETDFMGWLREGRVVGAVLTQGSATDPAGSELVAERVIATVSRELPHKLSSRLQVRIYKSAPRLEQ